jgi:hypothetical protein
MSVAVISFFAECLSDEPGRIVLWGTAFAEAIYMPSRIPKLRFNGQVLD